ncbi:MAG: NADH-quinone oxidoreductase subunit J family protein [Candidatus Kryptoniota bacterium]
MNVELLWFVIIAAVAVGSAALMITRQNPVFSALYLVLNFFCIAVLYLFLRAQFIAVIQITVYAGAIMVLFLFVIMLLNLGEGALPKWRFTKTRLLAVALSLILLAEVVPLFWAAFAKGSISPQSEKIGTVEAIGKTLFNQYLFPFEVTSFVLLAAMVGAILLAKKRFE